MGCLDSWTSAFIELVDVRFRPRLCKTREKSSNKKIDLSKRPLGDFPEVGKGYPTHEYVEFLRFYTAWTQSSHLRH